MMFEGRWIGQRNVTACLSFTRVEEADRVQMAGELATRSVDGYARSSDLDLDPATMDF